MANKNQGGARSGYTLAVNRQSFEPHSQDDAFHPIKHSKEALARITIGSCRSDALEALEREDQLDFLYPLASTKASTKASSIVASI